MLNSVRLYLMNLTSKAAWFRNRALLGFAIVGALAILLSLVLIKTEADRSMMLNAACFFSAFALTVLQA